MIDHIKRGSMPSGWTMEISVVRESLRNINVRCFIPSYSSYGKASACNVGDLGSIPGLGRSPGEGNDNPLQYTCQENPMD